jgi:hypothetical protein
LARGFSHVLPAREMRPPWMAEVPETQEQFSGRAMLQVESVYPKNGV